MKIWKHFMFMAIAAFIMIGCVSAPDLKRITMTTNVSSKVLNLRNSGNGNTNTVIADRVMKNGFLSTGEEYGYYTLDMTSRSVRGNVYFWGLFLTGGTLGVASLLGIPLEYEDYNLTVKLDILDSSSSVIRSYSDATTIRQRGGVYYGDATTTASRAFTKMIGNIQQIASAESDRINQELLSAGPIRRQAAQRSKDVTSAIENAAKVVMDSLKQRNLAGSRIAIVNISSQDKEQAEFIAAELEFMLVSGNFTIVDRRELDRIRNEQNFQLSGDVDDAQIVSIGKFAGAGIVITGSVTGTGSTRRLRLRALDTQTAEVRAVASEQF